ncbi:hypothetical protein ABPG72_005152 [Tetrahymena utriculariae]
MLIKVMILKKNKKVKIVIEPLIKISKIMQMKLFKIKTISQKIISKGVAILRGQFQINLKILTKQVEQRNKRAAQAIQLTQNLKFGVQNILNTIFNVFKCFKSDIQMILNFGTKNIYEFTDICYIVNKLIEVEKIKHLILNDQQLKLFDFVPKPKITKPIIEGYRQAKQDQKLLYKAINSKQTVQIDQLDSKLRRGSITQQLNILTIMNRSQLDKAREAQHAYNQIYKNQSKLSKIDKKLLLLLDEQHIPSLIQILLITL